MSYYEGRASWCVFCILTGGCVVKDNALVLDGVIQSEQRYSAEKGRIAKSAAVVAFYTGISRIAGLVRDVVVTHVFGVSSITDAFFVAFTIPNMLRRFVAEGGLTVAFIPVYLEVQEKEGADKAKALLSTTIGVLLLFLIVLCVVGIIGAKALVYMFASGFAHSPEKIAMTAELTRWLFPYVFFISLVALSMAVLNAHRHFSTPAASPIFLNLAMIGCAATTTGWFEEPIFALAVGVVLGGILQLALQIPALARHDLLVMPFRFKNWPAFLKLLRLMVPAVFGMAVYQVNLIVLRQLGSYMPDGQMSYYYNADRLMQFALGVFAISIATAVLPSLSRQTAKGDSSALVHTWAYSTNLTNFITVPAALGLCAVAIPLVSVLYLHGRFEYEDVLMTAYTTIAFAPSLVAIAMSRTTIQVYYALEDFRTPVCIGLFAVALNLGIGIILQKYEVVGLAATLSISSWAQTIILMALLYKRLPTLDMQGVLTGIAWHCFLGLVAVSASVLVVSFGDWHDGPSLVNISLFMTSLLVAIMIYFVAAAALGMEEVLIVRRALMRRRRK